MAFSVRDLLRLPSMKKARLLAGEQNIDCEISSIMVMEAPDVTGWLQPGHMLLSSLFSMQDSPDEELENLVIQVQTLKGVGIIVKTERFVKEIPSILVRACRKWTLPLIQIPPDVLYNDIQIEVMQALFNEKAALLDYHHKLHMQFTEYALKQPSFDEVMQTLGEMLGNPVAFLDHQMNLLCTTDERLQKLKILHPLPSSGSEMVFSYKKHAALLDEENIAACQITVEIPNIGDDIHYIIAADLNRKFQRPDYIALENAACFLQMRLIQIFAVGHVKQAYLNDLFDDLLNGKFVMDEQMRDAVCTLGFSIYVQYRIVSVCLIFENDDAQDSAKRKKEQQLFAESFRLGWGRSFYRIRAGQIIFVLPSKGESSLAFKERVSKSIHSALGFLREKNIRYHAGIGDACKITQISEFREQPLRLIQFAEAKFKESLILDSSDLGLFHFFTDIADSGKLLELVPAPLQKLHKERPVLSETLKVYLDNQLQLKVSADQLYVHPKTMRYRLNQICEITLIDFDNAEEILKYNIGFRALRLVGDEL